MNIFSEASLVLDKYSSARTNGLNETRKYTELLAVRPDQKIQGMRPETADDCWESTATNRFTLDQHFKFQRLRRAHVVYRQSVDQNRNTFDTLKRKASSLSALLAQVRQYQLENYRLSSELLSLQLEALETSRNSGN